MTIEDAIQIIERENLNRYKKVSFNGEDISENQLGIRETEAGWQFFCTNERGGIEIIETYVLKDDAISNMIEGLRVEKRLAERRLRKKKDNTH